MKHRIMSIRWQGERPDLYETRLAGEVEEAIEAIKELKAEGHRVSAWIVDDEHDGQARQRQSRR